MESRLQEERYGKERAKQELERRLDDAAKAKQRGKCESILRVRLRGVADGVLCALCSQLLLDTRP